MIELVLGDALEVLIDHRGKTPKKLGGDFTETGVPVASALLVADGVLNLTDARTVSHEMYRRWMPVPTRKGDVLLTSEAPLGRVARVPNDNPMVLGQRLFGLRGRPGVLDSGFLFYALQSVEVQAGLVGHATGTTVVGIRQSALRAVRISVPSWGEQQRIAEVLGAFDDKIAANRRIVDLALEYADALVLQGLVPSNTVPLAELGTVTMGTSPRSEHLNETGDGMVFYQGVRDFGARSPRPRVWSTDPVRTCGPEAVLIAVRAPVGDVNLATEATCSGRGVAAVESCRPLTLFHTLRVSSGLWAPFEGIGTVFSSISGPELKALPVPTVTDSDADRLEDALRTSNSSVTASLCVIDTLARTRDELLPLLMSGKLTVKDAEKRAEEVL